MSKKAKIKKLEKKLKALKKRTTTDCVTLTNPNNSNEQVTLSFVDGIVKFNKITKSEETTTVEISEVTFN